MVPGTSPTAAAPVPTAARLYRWHLGPGWRAASQQAIRHRVAGRTVLVTGASSGIGRATALALGRAGAHVIGLARDGRALDELATELGSPADSTMISCDLTDPVQVDAAAAQLAGRPVDIMINNAGLSLHRRLDRARDPVADLDRSVATNFSGPARLVTRLLPTLRRGAQLVVVGSVSVMVPTAGWAGYAGSKAGFDAWSRAVSAEVHPYGIATSTVQLPLVLTPMSAPTYRTPWGLTPDQAASVLLAVVVRRPRLLTPWWARTAGVASLLLPQVFDAITGRPRPRTRTGNGAGRDGAGDEP